MDEQELMQNDAEQLEQQEELQQGDELSTEQETMDDNQSSNATSENKNDYLPVAKYMEEKRRRRQAEEELRKFQTEKMSQEKVQKIDKIRAKVKEKGYDDDLVDLFGSFADEIYSSIPTSSGKSEDDFLLEQIRDAQDYEGLKDAVKYKDQIMARVKKNGLSIEDAYRLEVASKIKESQSDRRLQDEQIAAIKRRQASGDKAISVASDTSKNSASLTAEEKKEFEAVKRLRPEITIEKFKRLRGMYT